ncbi:DUF2612 domain-containing protein [Paenibacillus sp. P26]|nr:DUF2612 domain-containing protein [Paenibacillus sp. P26]UUZ85677.1 DUF2612 domain-containing protein [Paenibacillus sp. P26]UUZ95976.1 DUF2612 domain-containing protein [Paenibacillus sp. P25]
MAIEPYLDLITSGHRLKPKFIAWLSAWLTKIDDVVNVLNGLPSDFDIDQAVGTQLDLLGVLIGQKRIMTFPLSNGSPVLDDDHFRLLLKAQIAKNQWDGTIPQIYDIWDSLFASSGSQLQIIDNFDMTMQAIVTGMSDVDSSLLISHGLIIPRPMGVGITIIADTEISDQTYAGSVVSGNDSQTITAPAGN